MVVDVTGISSSEVQIGVLGRPVGGEDEHNHKIHVRQVRQHISGIYNTHTFIISSTAMLVSFSIFPMKKQSVGSDRNHQIGSDWISIGNYKRCRFFLSVWLTWKFLFLGITELWMPLDFLSIYSLN